MTKFNVEFYIKLYHVFQLLFRDRFDTLFSDLFWSDLIGMAYVSSRVQDGEKEPL